MYLTSTFCVDADSFEFLYSGIILLFKDEVLMYMAQNASQFSDYSLKPLVHHKWLLYIYSLATCASQAASL
jgi:hypothetical protein